MTLLSIDPSTSSLGYAIYKNGEPIDDGAIGFTYRSPLDYLTQLNGWLEEWNRRFQVTRVATEATFVSAFQGNASALLNVSSAQIQAWCAENGIPCHRYANSSVKKMVTGKGGAKKQAVYAAVVQYMSPESRKLPHPAKSQVGAGFDVADAHAIAQTAMAKHLKEDVKKKLRRSPRTA